MTVGCDNSVGSDISVSSEVSVSYKSEPTAVSDSAQSNRKKKKKTFRLTLYILLNICYGVFTSNGDIQFKV